MAKVAGPVAHRALWRDDAPIRIGVSACLVGQQVRFDGGHKRSEFLADTLGTFVEFVPVCPEVEIGLGVPRETLRLERGAGGVHLIAAASRADYTVRMSSYAASRTAALAHSDLCGYVLKKDSPSCGMERVRVYGPSGMPARNGVGLFASALMKRFPNLPVEEEGRLSDPHLRENFVERVFAYRRMHSFFSSRWTVGGLVRFHSAHKLLAMSHSPEAYRALGRLVAGAKRIARESMRAEYESRLMRALGRIASPARHTNVMHHMMGYLRAHLDAGGRRELAALVDDYRGGMVPLVVPITMFRHYVAKFGIEYLQGQVYLEPHPKELMLRNHV